MALEEDHEDEPLPQLSLGQVLRSRWTWLALAWFLGGRLALEHGAEFGLHIIYVVLSGFALIFTNLGRREDGSLSAYAIFNPGGQRLAGEFTAEQFEGQLRGAPVARAPLPAPVGRPAGGPAAPAGRAAGWLNGRPQVPDWRNTAVRREVFANAAAARALAAAAPAADH
jgi:hypothetical protein